MYLRKIENEVDEPETTIEELIEVFLDEKDQEKKVSMGAMLRKEEKEELANFLRKNKDIFSWSHKDILGIDPLEAEHFLNIDPTFPSV